MARMIPARIDDSVESSAERRIFELLQTDPDSGGWTVLHSVGLARRPTGPYGEIDFVVLIPNEGILCLEVKGGRVSCEGGIWRTVDRHGRLAELKKSPFAQAKDSMFALRNLIIGNFGRGTPEASCPISFAVVFPDVVCPPASPEFERSDVIDAEDLRGPISASISRVALNRLREFQPRGGERLPRLPQFKALVSYLRPNFDLVIAKSASLSRTEDRLLSLTGEQYDRLDELAANPRCRFTGGAGTGKTLLALEYARRAESTGAKVLFICFNRLLGDWLHRQTEDTDIAAGSWHRILREIIVSSSVGEEFIEHERAALEGQEFPRLFDELYPFYGEIALEEMDRPFDVLVMDEAQDLSRRSTLDLVNRAVRGGLAGGTWGIFGDFTGQALYGSDTESAVDLSEYCEHFVRATLTLNCRNTRAIAEEAAVFGGFSSPPFRLGREAGMPVERRYWKTEPGFARTLTDTVDRLTNGGIPADDIIILSTRRLENSVLADVEKVGEFPLVDCSRTLDAPQECLRFSTIHSFKGLESQVAIVVDIEDVEDARTQSILYVGMSRARGLLVLFAHERARKSIDTRLRAASAR